MEKKLTPKQNAVMWCLQNGWQVITDCQMKGAIIGCSTHQFHINNGLFWRLDKMGLIRQGTWEKDMFGWVITDEGKKIKTTPVTI